MPVEVIIKITYDNTRGVFEARINNGVRFLFSGHRDSPMPKSMANALEGLRRYTILSASGQISREDHLSLDEILEKVKDYEAKGNRIQTVGVQKAKAFTPLSIEDLDLDED